VSRNQAEAALPAFVPAPSAGRTFVASCVVRSTDVTAAGRLRLDAVARYLQDAAEDDLADTGWSPPYGWLLRRCAITVRDFPGFGEKLTLCTFCSGAGPRWAERTTTLARGGAELMQARAVWVAIARDRGDPVPLGQEFYRWYGESAQGRRVSARLSLPGPDAAAASADGASGSRDWPLRAVDFDTAGHVNNSVHWAAIEELLAERDWLPGAAEMEYHRPVLPGHSPRLRAVHQPGQLLAWLMDGTARLASGRLVGAAGADKTHLLWHV
jgi:acyl-ACP thioesterase